MLEIGVLREQSLRMWEEYFPHAQVFGADVRRHRGERMIQLDQSNPSQLRQVAKLRNWTVVLDDGSHKPTHQLATFMTFFPLLRPGGVYIIEDVETSYWARRRGRGTLYGWSMRDEDNSTDVIMRLQQVVHSGLNAKYQCPDSADDMPAVFSLRVDREVAAVIFLRNAVAVIKAPGRYVSHERKGVAFYSKRWAQDCNETRWTVGRRLPSVASVLERRGLLAPGWPESLITPAQQGSGCSVRVHSQLSSRHPCVHNITFGCSVREGGRHAVWCTDGCRARFVCSTGVVKCSSATWGPGRSTRTTCDCPPA